MIFKYVLFVLLAPVERTRTLDAQDQRTAFEIIEDANNDAENLRGEKFVHKRVLKEWLRKCPLEYQELILRSNRSINGTPEAVVKSNWICLRHYQ